MEECKRCGKSLNGEMAVSNGIELFCSDDCALAFYGFSEIYVEEATE